MVIVALALAAATGCGSPSSGPGSGSGTTVRLQNYAGGSTYLAYLTKHLGFFEREGLDAEIVDVSTGPQAANALLSGSLDAALLNPFLVEPLLSQGQKLELISGQKGPYPALVGSKKMTETGWPRSLEQLKGKNIGVLALGGADQTMCEIALRGAGVGATDVTFVATGSGQGTGAALATGNVDAGCVSDVPTASLTADGFPVLFDFVNPQDPVEEYPEDVRAVTGDFSYLQYWSRTEWAQENPQKVDGMRRAFANTVAWMRNPANADELVSIMKESPYHVDTFPDEEFAEFIRGSVSLYNVGFSNESAQTWMHIMGDIRKTPLPPQTEWVEESTPTTQAEVDQLLTAPSGN
ncbi:hypothetical protein AXA44_22010 [Rhodococcus sp. SC4]|nr:hypothetical protein AXA44_22010 [Rhodococcus sp. SC4]